MMILKVVGRTDAHGKPNVHEIRQSHIYGVSEERIPCSLEGLRETLRTAFSRGGMLAVTRGIPGANRPAAFREECEDRSRVVRGIVKEIKKTGTAQDRAEMMTALKEGHVGLAERIFRIAITPFVAPLEILARLTLGGLETFEFGGALRDFRKQIDGIAKELEARGTTQSASA